MVVLNENPPFKNIACDGYKTSFDTPKYAINAPEELKVLFTDSSNAQFTLEYGIDYTINEFGNPDGTTITFPMEGSSYSVGQAGDILSLLIDPPIIQEKPYQDTGSVLPSALERSLDYITKICSSLSRKIERCVKVQEGLSINPDELMDNLYQSASQAASSASAASISAGQAVSSAATIAAGLAQLNGIGDLEDLDTTEKDTLVEAINEVVADVSDVNSELNPDTIQLGTITSSEVPLTENRIHTAHISANTTIVLPTISASSLKSVNCLINFSIASGFTLDLPVSGVKHPFGTEPTFSTSSTNSLLFYKTDGQSDWIIYYSDLRGIS